ncbi:hypothetical protein B8Z96_21545 [Klebsiella pneumoniae]|nr:hypothetical protein [Klebsiella pneumoniae]OVF46847.1 hypothetical protein B8Z96_21545 [Klebsiella pneumoniae]
MNKTKGCLIANFATVPFIFLNTFKYVSAHETITLINASIILKKEEYEYSTFPNKVRHHKVQHRDQQQRFRHTAPHD